MCGQMCAECTTRRRTNTHNAFRNNNGKRQELTISRECAEYSLYKLCAWCARAAIVCESNTNMIYNIHIAERPPHANGSAKSERTRMHTEYCETVYTKYLMYKSHTNTQTCNQPCRCHCRTSPFRHSQSCNSSAHAIRYMYVTGDTRNVVCPNERTNGGRPAARPTTTRRRDQKRQQRHRQRQLQRL